jgi:mRNA interferase YafQ
MTYFVFPTKQYEKSLAKHVRAGKVTLELVNEVVLKLAAGAVLVPKYNDHALNGKYLGYRECHIKPDILLLYKRDKGKLILMLMNLGSHSDFF